MGISLLASACLCGVACRYDGQACPHEGLMALHRQGRVLAVCPEFLGGLCAPRMPCELADGRVIDRAGADLTLAFRLGAARTLALARSMGITCAVLKDKSPSCGSTVIYNGTFSGLVVPGQGVTAALLRDAGLAVYAEHTLPDIPGLTA